MEKTMLIRLSTMEDLPEMMRLIDCAREFMIREGNTLQWPPGYPSEEQIGIDIARGHSYVCMHPDYPGLVGTFYFAVEEEPTYRKIDGAWLNDLPYGVVHRLASDGRSKGLFQACLTFAQARCTELRVDTHVDNKRMRHLLLESGFIPCGTIYVADGSPRIAYHKSLQR